MNKREICIIDDKFPFSKHMDLIQSEDESLMQSHSVVKYFVSQADTKKWDEPELFNFTKSLLEISDISVTAFFHHQFFINYINDNEFSADLIVFDWDVGDSNPEIVLKEIVAKLPIPVAVYTGADNYDEIETIIKENFSDKMVFLHTKGEGVEYTISKLDEYSKYLVVEKSKKIRKKIHNATNEIFNRFRSISTSDYISLFGSSSGNDFVLSGENITEILMAKLKIAMLDAGIDDWICPKTEQSISRDKILEAWNFRLFSNLNNDRVRQGDIFCLDNQYYFVASSDCFLCKFWEKTFGTLLVVPLYDIKEEELFLNRAKSLSKLKNAIGNCCSSMVSNPQGFAIIPGVKKDEGRFHVCFIYAKNLSTIVINEHFDGQLKYEHIKANETKAKFVQHLIEPFCSALVSFIQKNFTDIGIDDFSPPLLELLKDSVNDVFEKIKNSKIENA